MKGEEGASSGLRASRSGLGVVDVVDVGAGEGELLSAADAALRAWGIREEFRLVGVERSAVRRAKAVGNCPGATWLSSLEEILFSSLSGLIVCYELFDALPVRALFFEGEKLLERVVTLGPGGEGFAWGLAECADGAELLGRFQARGIHLQRNQRLEMRSGAPRLAQSLAASLVRPPPRLRLRRSRARALLGRARERNARGVPIPRRHARRPRGAGEPRPDGVGRLFGARGRVHVRRPLRRGARQPVARPRGGAGSSRSSRSTRRDTRPGARGGSARRGRARPAGWNGRVDPRSPRVPRHRSRLRARVVAGHEVMPLHRLTSPGSAHRILLVLTEAGRRAGAVGPRGVCP